MCHDIYVTPQIFKSYVFVELQYYKRYPFSLQYASVALYRALRILGIIPIHLSIFSIAGEVTSKSPCKALCKSARASSVFLSNLSKKIDSSSLYCIPVFAVLDRSVIKLEWKNPPIVITNALSA